MISDLSREQSRVKAAMCLKKTSMCHVDVNFESVLLKVNKSYFLGIGLVALRELRLLPMNRGSSSGYKPDLHLNAPRTVLSSCRGELPVS